MQGISTYRLVGLDPSAESIILNLDNVYNLMQLSGVSNLYQVMASNPTQELTLNTYAFYNCSRLALVSLAGLTYIPSYAFYNCSSLEEAIFPKAANIYPYAFMGCSNLSHLELSSSLYYVGEYALASTRLPSVLDLTNCNTWGSYAFANCLGLEDVTINSFSNNNSYINSVFKGAKDLKRVTYLGTRIHGSDRYNNPSGCCSMFADCSQLSEVYMQNLSW